MAVTSSWPKRHKITIDHTKVTSGDHTDFPVLLADGNFLDDCYTNAKSDGSDIRFTTDEAGQSEIAFEIVKWDQANKKAEVWVKIASLSSSTDVVIYVWYGNASASAYSHTDTYGTHAVWSNGFQAVWHLQSGGGDSSPNGYDLTVNGSPTNTAVKIGNGYTFDANASKYLEKTSATNLQISGSQTWTAWIKVNTTNTDTGIVSMGGNCGLYAQDIGSFGLQFYLPGVGAYVRNTQDTNLNYTAGVYNNSTIARFLNKTKASASFSGAVSGQGTTIRLGQTASGAWALNGSLDEVRIANVARSDGWLNTEYDNQNSPSTFSAGSDSVTVSWTSIKTMNGLAKSSVKHVLGLAVASVKTALGLA